MVSSARPAWSLTLASLLVTVGCAADGGGEASSGETTETGAGAGATTESDSPTATGDAGGTGGVSESEGGETSHGTAEPGDGGEATAAVTDESGESGASGETDETGETGEETGDVPASRCEATATTITCPKTTVEFGPWQRDVHFQVPLGEPPAGGWPAVLMFQGSLFSAEATWVATEGLPFGAFYQTHVVKQLLDHGYAVITPETKLNGGTFWDTNVPPYSINWESSEDHELMLLLFAAIADGSFGPLDAARLFATGISSGGYMTSRMAVSYPGKFRSLAIAAGSYATCSGPICNVPALDPGHPPTLFLHGEVDLTVPLSTAVEYYDKLIAVGVDARLVTTPGEGHGWIPPSPEEVRGWFDQHP